MELSTLPKGQGSPYTVSSNTSELCILKRHNNSYKQGGLLRLPPAAPNLFFHHVDLATYIPACML